jgi:hypothetical protein
VSYQQYRALKFFSQPEAGQPNQLPHTHKTSNRNQTCSYTQRTTMQGFNLNDVQTKENSKTLTKLKQLLLPLAVTTVFNHQDRHDAYKSLKLLKLDERLGAVVTRERAPTKLARCVVSPTHHESVFATHTKVIVAPNDLSWSHRRLEQSRC